MKGSREAGYRALAARRDRWPVARPVVDVGQLRVRKRGCLRVTATHLLGEAANAVGVVSFDAEVLPGDEPVSALPGTGRLDVGRLLARLPSAGHDERARDGRSLRAVNVLRVAEAQPGEVVAFESALAAGDVKLDKHAALGGDVEHLSPAAVLDALLAGLVVLVDERYPVAGADAVVNTGYGDFQLA